jgi:hypothetical protein
MFLLCPDFEENTTIYVVMPGLAERGGWATWQRPPFSGPGEITSSLQVLYGQRSLHGM